MAAIGEALPVLQRRGRGCAAYVAALRRRCQARPYLALLRPRQAATGPGWAGVGGARRGITASHEGHGCRQGQPLALRQATEGGGCGLSPTAEEGHDETLVPAAAGWELGLETLV
ncbi:hypothetical protein Cni_G12612 [Canna indica]|uniref:Uncharacterized protein n=1 Tax=Canna indica TaxID=4628 RepID=A0AAQ3K854_9LILI|nr:hypothetical protein Cni_G12612 [Canna indica]